MANVVFRTQSIQYDGTNGADLLALLASFHTVVSDDGTNLVISDTERNKAIPNGGYMVYDPVNGYIEWVGSAADYAGRYIEI